jgi:hypothetical protein
MYLWGNILITLFLTSWQMYMNSASDQHAGPARRQKLSQSGASAYSSIQDSNAHVQREHHGGAAANASSTSIEQLRLLASANTILLYHHSKSLHLVPRGHNWKCEMKGSKGASSSYFVKRNRWPTTADDSASDMTAITSTGPGLTV